MVDYKAQVLSRIKVSTLVDKGYVQEVVPKKTIFIHHTAGSADPYQVVKWWNTQANMVSTAFVIGGSAPTGAKWIDGELVQAFNSKMWGYHLGLKSINIPAGSVGNKLLNAQAIGIEMCSWGYLTQKDGKFVTYAGNVLPADQVFELPTPFRGYKFYHKYSIAQLETLKMLLLYLTDEYQIPRDYKGDGIFEITQDALLGKPGIWTHTSVRQDKFDCFPYPPLIDILRELKNA